MFIILKLFDLTKKIYVYEKENDFRTRYFFEIKKKSNLVSNVTINNLKSK